MFLICLHHACVHGPWWDYSFSTTTYAVVYALSFGGKIGVNIFVLITGYFLVTAKFKIASLLRTILEVLFYSIIIYFIYLFIFSNYIPSGYEIRAYLPNLTGLYWFATTYIGLYALSPIFNAVISKAKQSGTNVILSIGFILLCVIPTFITYNPFFSNLLWFCYMYVIGGYIKLYLPFQTKTSIANPTSLIKKVGTNTSIFICLAFLLGSAEIIYLFQIKGFDTPISPRYFMSEWSLPTVLLSIALFLAFNKLKPMSSKVINLIASTTFGVYLIHDNALVRSTLWSLIANTGYYNALFFAISLITICVIVFIICSCFDYLRKRLIEEPVFHVINSHFRLKFDKVDKAINSFMQ